MWYDANRTAHSGYGAQRALIVGGANDSDDSNIPSGYAGSCPSTLIYDSIVSSVALAPSNLHADLTSFYISTYIKY